MHHKKSEVQIGKESSGVSSDYNRTPFHTSSSESNAPHFLSSQDDPVTPTPSTTPILSTPHKRPLMTHIPSLTKSPTFASALHNYQASTAPQFNSHFPATPQFNSHFSSLFSISPSLKTIAVRLFHRLRRFRVHFRFILLLTLPFFWLLVSHPTHSYFLDFFSAFFFSAALLFSLNLALPRLPSIRLFLARSFPVKLVSGCAISRPALPVFWSIGSRPKPEKKANSGCCVEVYNNGDVYEGELHKGKCLGSGVYYYYMSGRYEGDWVDGKYDGYGWRLGRGEAGTAVSIGRVSGMGLECIDFILVMYMLGNGRMGKVMGVEPILVKTVVDMWGNSSGVLSTAMATIILGLKAVGFLLGPFYS
ncbi:hypothetical protein CK203_090418 [Vitis vinifera]|uniref:Uncharacterized protein n=1 Tax=Vitis vinifera TaxID=29760 RepID=A0A438BVL1_VITVI|nr:hypothetical protein CK203_090418 [Vitis vinifera]